MQKAYFSFLRFFNQIQSATVTSYPNTVFTILKDGINTVVA